MPETLVWNVMKSKGLSLFQGIISFEASQGRKLTGVPSSTVGSRAPSLASTCHLWP
jgi:hypothetical protein